MQWRGLGRRPGRGRYGRPGDRRPSRHELPPRAPDLWQLCHVGRAVSASCRWPGARPEVEPVAGVVRSPPFCSRPDHRSAAVRTTVLQPPLQPREIVPW